MGEKLIRLTERVWYYPWEEERDRPNLGYIRGDNWSLAVDAGHSKAHTLAFCRAIEEAGLPPVKLTVLTHWHWDHTLGLHAMPGLSLANKRTNAYLIRLRERIEREGTQALFRLDEKIVKEYAGGAPVTVSLPDMLFAGEMLLDAGHCPVRVFEAGSPHTDDATLIEVPGEGVLFTGDAECGVFPTWVKDKPLCAPLIEAIGRAGAELCVGGHWAPRPKAEALRELEED